MSHIDKSELGDPAEYRSGVGIILINCRGEVLVARRNDVEGDAWQLPQGGIDADESPGDAVMRELREELGTDKAEIIAESQGWFSYDVPRGLAPKAWGERSKGQRQKWFVMCFRGRDEDIDLQTEHPEFDAWKWVQPSELPALATPFKRELYAGLLGEFSTVFRD